MRNKTRRWDTNSDDDPLAGLVNLFDLWMVFSIALLLSLVSYLREANIHADNSAMETKDAGTMQTESLDNQRQKLDHYRVSHDKLTGEGQRLGTAYRLKSGEVVYVPDP